MWHGNSLLYHEELSILRGRKSVPGINSRERGNGKKRTTLSSQIDLEFAQNKVVAKLPLLKQGDYDMWKLRIKQYFQVQDYALWDVIENGNSFNLVPRITANPEGTSTLTISVNTRMSSLCLKPYKQDSVKNKPDLETMSFDDLYNSFKIVEQKVKRTVVLSSSSGSPNMAFLSSPSSTNEVDTASIQVSVANTPVSIVSSPNNNANMNDETVYAFLANQPNGSQLVHENLEQIHEDDLEEMDLKWQLALLSMRARRECRSQRCQESWPRNQDSSIKTVIVEDTSSKAMVAIDGAAFTWSYMGDDEVPANMALMAFSDSDMIQKRVLKTVKKGSGQREVRLVWNHAIRVNHQNFSNSRRNFAPTAVLTKSGIVPISTARQSSSRVAAQGDRQAALRDTRIFDSGCSRRVTRNKSFLSEYQEYDGGFVAFAGSSKGGKITGKCKIRTGKLDFEDVYFMKELKFNLFSVSQMCDKKNSVLFTETECLVLSPDLSCLMKIKYCLRCDNGTEFKNYEMNQFCGIKGIKREFSNARTPQQNGVAKRKNMTLIKAARTMLADSLLPIPFWAKAPYELLIGRAPIISFMRPFGCPVTILNTLDHLEKFDGKADEGFLVSYSINSKAFRVYNSRTKKVEENLHVNFVENKPNVTGSGPEWLFNINSLTNSKNYQPVSAGNRTNGIAGSKIHSDVGQKGKEKVSDQEYILLPVLNTSLYVPSSNEEVESSPKDDAGKKSIVKPTCVKGGKIDDLGCLDQQMKSTDDSENTNSTNSFNTVSLTINTASDKDETFQRTYGEWNFLTPITVNAVGSSFSHPATLDDFSKMPNLEDTRIFNDAYDDRDEGTEADYNNLEIVISVSHIPSTRIYKDHPKEQIIGEVFAPVARIKEIRLFLAYASFMDFTVYQMDVKSAFLYGTIEEEVYVSQPPGFVDLQFPDKVRSLSTKFEQLMHNRFQMSSMRELTFFLGLKVGQRKDGIFLSQEKYVCDILKKFSFSSVKSASTPMETHKPLSKDLDGTGVGVHLYWSMIWSLMYLTSSRPDIMFAVCACSRFQVQPKFSHMHAVKRIFRYLKGHPTLGLWYPKDSPLELISYSDNDYAGVSLHRKSTTRGCQFLGSRLISWQCKKQTIVANSTTEAEYIVASSCCGQVVWLHQLLDYGYNFMQAKIHVDNESVICVVKNPVYHSKT
uniref:Putative ribonuclease H-like domain-containing protein n=1 Tax=Tanacetum cinerariifolium TaxID=118510 RepID=A0A6L2LV66_TANCI|nr:putative ribonuclease H-like domain-containing protein [Tanacetum cinerariifolium]